VRTHLHADRERFTREISNLLDLVANGISAETIAPKIRERQTALAKVEAALRTPRQAPPNIEKLRAALEQRATQWKAELRAEPKVARLMLRRLVGPLTLWDEADAGLPWDAEPRADELLDGLVQLGSSRTGFGNAGAARSAATRYPRKPSVHKTQRKRGLITRGIRARWRRAQRVAVCLKTVGGRRPSGARDSSPTGLVPFTVRGTVRRMA